MVLQQKSNVPVWGWDTPGKVIQVTGSWNNKTDKTVTDKSGKWMLKLVHLQPEALYTYN